MNTSRVRIADIAEELGLSTATVSNVIHGKTNKISDETVKRVQELLEKRQYIPSMAGILLAQNDSKIIGVVINDHEKYCGHTLEDNFIAASVNSLMRQVDKSGYFLMIKVTDDCLEIPKFASMWNMVGLILIGYCEQDYRKLKSFMHIPLVVYDGFVAEEAELVNIEVDHYSGGVEAGRYLKEKGHEKVACISDNDVCMDLLRYNGLKSVYPDAQLYKIPYEMKARHDYYMSNMHKLIKNSAIFAVSDYYAIDLMQFLIGQGIKIPDDISIIGFDDIPAASYINPPLTTIHQDHEKRAELAIEMLIKQRKGVQCPQNIRLDVSVTERSSVGNMHK